MQLPEIDHFAMAEIASPTCPAWREHETPRQIQEALASEVFSKLKDPLTLTYDTVEFPFRENLLAALLRRNDLVTSEESEGRKHIQKAEKKRREMNKALEFQDRLARLPLEKIHLAVDPKSTPDDELHIPRRNLGRVVARSLRRSYERFVCAVVAPHLRASTGCELLAFQSVPCLRIQPPSRRMLTHLHTDAMYHHQPGQINFWLALTRTHDSSSLWVESAPGANDHRPLQLDYGQAARFYGNRCSHFAPPNATEDTRVSLDFRAIPGPCFDPDPPQSRDAAGRPMFAVGGYYSLCRWDPAAGRWEVDRSVAPAGAGPGPPPMRGSCACAACLCLSRWSPAGPGPCSPDPARAGDEDDGEGCSK